jgi:hypothetical protein
VGRPTHVRRSRRRSVPPAQRDAVVSPREEVEKSSREMERDGKSLLNFGSSPHFFVMAESLQREVYAREFFLAKKIEGASQEEVSPGAAKSPPCTPPDF